MSGSTERLYYTDALVADFEAKVIDRGDDGRRIYLDRTAFYPTSGGQPHDTGTIDRVAVIDVVDEGDRIAHILERPLATPATVRGVLDWTRRQDHMQQHTGQHLLSAVFEELFGAATASVHFGDSTSTLDLATDSLGGDRIRRAELRANEIVAEARPVRVSFEDASAAEGLRKATGREGTIRIVSIEGIDRSACGGTHVATTARIGTILVRRSERVREGIRVEFVCGNRAIARARSDFEALTSIAAGLSAGIDDAATLVARQSEQLRLAANERQRLERELARYEARALYDAAAPGANGLRVVALAPGDTLDRARALAQQIVELERMVLVAAASAPPAVLLAASGDSGVNAGALLKSALSGVGGRGGGSPRMAQGSAPDAASANRVAGELRAAVELSGTPTATPP